MNCQTVSIIISCRLCCLRQKRWNCKAEALSHCLPVFPKKETQLWQHCNCNSWMIWTLPRNVSVLVAYQKRLCVSDPHLHEYCFVRCNLSGETGKNSLAVQEWSLVFPPLLSTSCYTIISLETPMGFWINPLFWVFGNRVWWSRIPRACEGKERQGDVLICLVTCCSFMLVRRILILYNWALWAPWQSTVFRQKTIYLKLNGPVLMTSLKKSWTNI